MIAYLRRLAGRAAFAAREGRDAFVAARRDPERCRAALADQQAAVADAYRLWRLSEEARARAADEAESVVARASAAGWALQLTSSAYAAVGRAQRAREEIAAIARGD